MKSLQCFVIGSGMAAVAGFPGCAAPRGVSQPPRDGAIELTPIEGGGTASTMLADWDDADPAVLAALSRCETTFTSLRREGGRTNEAAGVLVYDLLTITEQPGVLTLTREGEPDEGPVLVRVEVVIGDAGDERFERCVAEAVAIRLRQLRGVGAAPLRWD